MKISDFFLLVIKESIKKAVLLYSIISDFLFKIRNIKRSKSYLIKGDLKNESSHILIYATYLAEKNKSIVNYHLDIFDEIFDNIIIINNSENIKKAHKLTCNLRADVIINRYNSGRDIGAFKQGYFYIYNNIDSLINLEKITFINDSIIITDKDLLLDFSKSELFDCSYHGSTYSLSPYFHGQSFLFSFSKNLFKRHELKNFFKHYRLVNSRHNAVYNGELGLFKAIQSTNCKINFCYDPLNIFKLKGHEYSELIESLPLNILNIISNNISKDNTQITDCIMDHISKKSINKRIDREIIAELENMTTAYDLGLVLAKSKKLPFLKSDLVKKNKAECFDYLFFLKKTLNDDFVFSDIRNKILKNGVYRNLSTIEKIKMTTGIK